MCLMLGDPAEFEGGDLEVMAGSAAPVTLEQRQGRAWFFPSYILHRVTPVTQGTRRSVVVWAGGPSFR
jgi:PKHD-type hydroxylase